jgi:hypothetical protein
MISRKTLAALFASLLLVMAARGSGTNEPGAKATLDLTKTPTRLRVTALRKNADSALYQMPPIH